MELYEVAGPYRIHSASSVSLIDNSNYTDLDKHSMKHDLEIVKETLSQEIERRFRSS